MYADTDFFLALLKKEDRLKERAEKLFARHKNVLWSSTLVLQELLFFAYNEKINPTELVEGAMNLMKIRESGLSLEHVLGATYLMRKYGLAPFDALHAMAAGEEAILSSDRAFDKIGMERVRLEK